VDLDPECVMVSWCYVLLSCEIFIAHEFQLRFVDDEWELLEAWPLCPTIAFVGISTSPDRASPVILVWIRDDKGPTVA
jgi:hypothetical protein